MQVDARVAVVFRMLDFRTAHDRASSVLAIRPNPGHRDVSSGGYGNGRWMGAATVGSAAGARSRSRRPGCYALDLTGSPLVLLVLHLASGSADPCGDRSRPEQSTGQLSASFQKAEQTYEVRVVAVLGAAPRIVLEVVVLDALKGAHKTGQRILVTLPPRSCAPPRNSKALLMLSGRRQPYALPAPPVTGSDPSYADIRQRLRRGARAFAPPHRRRWLHVARRAGAPPDIQASAEACIRGAEPECLQLLTWLLEAGREEAARRLRKAVCQSQPHACPTRSGVGPGDFGDELDRIRFREF